MALAIAAFTSFSNPRVLLEFPYDNLPIATGSQVTAIRTFNNIPGGLRRGARLVVAKAHIEARQINLAIEQVIQRMLEGTRQQLPPQIDRQQSRTHIDLLVASHAVSVIRRRSSFDLDARYCSA